jgi:phosphoglycolate phosphatase
MTPDPDDELARALRGTECLLLDFDGPICTVFAGRSARTVVLKLLDVLTASGTPIPHRVANANDPFDVLRHAATISRTLAQRVEARLRENEIAATRSAAATPHAADVISTWRAAGRQVAVVSNNSAAAVGAYLAEHAITVDLVAARTSSDPALLKPSPHLVTAAIEKLGADRAVCALVGDSRSDMTAAEIAGITRVGYANKPGKREALAAAGAQIVIDDVELLARTVATTSP